jgi:hypothetical protein
MANTDHPEVHYETPPDSGYSVDNIAPSPPQNLIWETPCLLRWDACGAEDFEHFTIYGSSNEEFDDADVILGQTEGTTWDVTGSPYDFYHVTAKDLSGNESDAATIGGHPAAGPAEELRPSGFVLHPCRPNPAIQQTEIAFDLPSKADIRLLVFDAAGRCVASLAEGEFPAGSRRVSWRGEDLSGKPVLAGIYFYRLEVPLAGFSETRKVLLTR